ncbi:MAG: hypothetical protein KAH13_03325, partial [Tenericutes bacterium]|nr:hypothetical protein [Mycoplasmatota bacterium]
MKNIDILLSKIDLEDEIIKEYCSIDKIEVDEISETWTFFFMFSQTIPILHYRNFINRILKLGEYVPSVRYVDYQITFEEVDPDLVLEYYDFALDVIAIENKRISPLKEYPTDIENNVLKIYIPKGAVTATIFRKEIENEMRRNGFNFDVEIEVDQSIETVDQSIQNTIDNFCEANKFEFDEAIEYIYLTNGGEISNFNAIKSIPRTDMELEEYKENHGGKAIISMHGICVYQEIYETKISARSTMVVTDGEDSIFVIKKGVKAMDLKFFRQIEKDTGVIAKCYAAFDVYTQEVVLHPIAIARSNKPVRTDQRLD